MTAPATAAYAGVPEHPLGVKVMDDDHAVLEALLRGAATLPDDALPGALGEIAAEVEAHFHREEEEMRRHAVPVLFCHMAQHKRIVDLLAAAQKLAGPQDMVRLRTFLTVMLPGEIEAHINSVDRMSARFMTGELPTQASEDLRLPERDILQTG